MAGPYKLLLYSEDPTVLEVLKKRGAEYVVGHNSGFDLETVTGPDIPSKGHHIVLLSTEVKALVLDGSGSVCAFQLFARSSLPRMGWILVNGVGLIDRNYRDPLKALLYDLNPSGYPVEAWRCLIGVRVVQIVAPDCQPFVSVTIFDTDGWANVVKHADAVAPDRGGGFGSTGC